MRGIHDELFKELAIAFPAELVSLQEQQARIDSIPNMKKDNKQLLKAMMEVMGPVMSGLGSAIVKGVRNGSLSQRQETQVREIVTTETKRIEDKFELQAAETACRVQNALIEDHYRSDRISCRLRFKNMRIRGVGDEVADLGEYAFGITLFTHFDWSIHKNLDELTLI